MNTRLNSEAIVEGGFIVIIPFIKKKARESSGTVVEKGQGVGNGSSVSDADLAWQDIMNDVSDLRDVSSNSDECFVGERNLGSVEKGQGFGNSNEGVRDELIVSIMKSTGNDGLLGDNCKKLVTVLEMVGCLSVLEFGDCLLHRKSCLSNEVELLSKKNDRSSCGCPVWLKGVLKAFTFLNLVYSHLQQQGQVTTWDFLVKVLVHLGSCELQIDTENLDSLALLCPKVWHCRSKFCSSKSPRKMKIRSEFP